MANFEKNSYGKAGFFFGDNIAEAGTITSADADVALGTVLVRNSAKNWVPATADTLIDGAGLGLAIADVAKGTAVPCDVGIAGRFNRNFIKVGSSAITDAQADLLRGQGIICFSTTELRK